MAFPKFHPYRSDVDISQFCNTACGILQYKRLVNENCPKRVLSFYTQGNRSKKKIMLVLDCPLSSQVANSNTPQQDYEDSVLWGSKPHKILKMVLKTLIDETHDLFITHALKCEGHPSFYNNFKNLVFTTAKEVTKKKAAKELYEEEKAHFTYCMNHLIKEIEAYDPDIIVTFGHRVTNIFLPNEDDLYKSRGKNTYLELAGRERLIISTVGTRDVYIHNHHASQWKADLGRAIWLSQSDPAYQKIPTSEQMLEIKDPAYLSQVIDYLEQSGTTFAWDTETTGLKKVENKCIMLSFSFDGINGFTIPIEAEDFIPDYDAREFKRLAFRLLCLPNPKICFNTKFDIEAVAALSPDPKWTPWVQWDASFMAYVFEEHFGDPTWRAEKSPGLSNTAYGWLSLAGQVIDILGIWDQTWLSEKENRKDMVEAIARYGWTDIARYAAKDAIYTWRVWKAYMILLDVNLKDSRDKVAGGIMAKACWLLAQIEKNGLPIDASAIAQMEDVKIKGSIAYEAQQAQQNFLKNPDVQRFSALEAAEKAAADKKEKTAKRASLFEMPGLKLNSPESFNLNSNPQLVKFFYGYLKLEPVVAGTYSTDNVFLDKHADKVETVQYLKQFRERTKLTTVFLPSFRTNAAQYSDNRVRASYFLTTVTGRTSCIEPNLQQIPRSGESGNEIKGLVKKVIKVRPGYAMVQADYANAEVRVMGIFAQDTAMQKVFNNVDSYRLKFIQNPSKELFEMLKFDADFHRQNASALFNVPIREVTKELRSKAKALTFTILFAANAAPTLAADLKIPLPEAQKLVDRFRDTYKDVAKLFIKLERFASENGFVETLFGYRRVTYGLWASSNKETTHCLNAINNNPVQNAAAIWTLLAAHDYQKLANESGEDIRIINTVHDAIYVEMPIHCVKIWAPILLRTMEKPPSVKESISKEDFEFIPMSADCEISSNMYDTQAWDDTEEHLDRLIEWVTNGADPNAKPKSLYA
jgi:DNA polymerase I-like protein with 3'-5' exonuclease and polymerase domains/uracil-DNA glycosylase